MPTWKRIVLKAAGFGAGAVVAATLVIVFLVWYKSRPPRPWNRQAITADFYRVTTTGDRDSKLEFDYILENRTDSDLDLPEYSTPKIAVRLEDTNSLSGFAADQKQIVLKLPVFVPAHQKTRINITTPTYGFSTPTYLTDSSTTEERHKYYAEVAAHVAKNMVNLNGFVLFDENSRYEIDLPSGWKNGSGGKPGETSGQGR